MKHFAHNWDRPCWQHTVKCLHVSINEIICVRLCLNRLQILSLFTLGLFLNVSLENRHVNIANYFCASTIMIFLLCWQHQWRHNQYDGVSNHRRLDCLLYSLFRCRSKKTSHRWPVDSPHKGPVKRKMYPFHDVIMKDQRTVIISSQFSSVLCIYTGYFLTLDVYQFHHANLERAKNDLLVSQSKAFWKICIYLNTDRCLTCELGDSPSFVFIHRHVQLSSLALATFIYL